MALIRAPADLGAIPTLFGKPQQYASVGGDGRAGEIVWASPLSVGSEAQT